MFQCVLMCHHEHCSQPLSLKWITETELINWLNTDLFLSHVHVYKQEIKKKVKCCQKSIIRFFLIYHSYLFFDRLYIYCIYTRYFPIVIYLFIYSSQKLLCHTKLKNFSLFILLYHSYLFFDRYAVHTLLLLF